MDIRILSLACRYYQGPTKDRPKTDQRPTKDRSRNVFFLNCKDVILSFWYDLYYMGTAYELGQGGGWGEARQGSPGSLLSCEIG